MEPPLADLLPALAQAARTVGSPQIRHAATIGGNLGTCVAGRRRAAGARRARRRRPPRVGRRASGRRAVRRVHDRRRSARRCEPGELITAVTVPVLDGWQGYAKVGVRNAMVIAIAGACLAVDDAGRTVRLALGSVGPTIIRCTRGRGVRRGRRRLRRPRSRRRADVVAEFGATGRRGAPADRRPPLDRRPTAATPIGVLAGRLLRRAFPNELTPTTPTRSHETSTTRCTSTASTTRSPTRGSARACCTCCASGSACSAARARASRASAARAACWSTASWCAAASCWPPSAIGQAIVTDRGHRRRPARRATCSGVRRRRRGAVRVLHARADHGRPRPARARRRSRPSCEIREELSGNICRCTGYGRIIDAVQRVAVLARATDGDATVSTSTRRRRARVARSARRQHRRGPTASPRCRARSRSPATCRADGMLWGATLRSPHPYARIVSIDVSPAWRSPASRRSSPPTTCPASRRTA